MRFSSRILYPLSLNKMADTESSEASVPAEPEAVPTAASDDVSLIN